MLIEYYNILLIEMLNDVCTLKYFQMHFEKAYMFQK